MAERPSPDGHHYGMVIDLNACTGCSACVIACQAENNIPVVGKDRGCGDSAKCTGCESIVITKNENGSVDVAHQPMLCQHCGNAPCEVVLPSTGDSS